MGWAHLDVSPARASRSSRPLEELVVELGEGLFGPLNALHGVPVSAGLEGHLPSEPLGFEHQPHGRREDLGQLAPVEMVEVASERVLCAETSRSRPVPYDVLICRSVSHPRAYGGVSSRRCLATVVAQDPELVGHEPFTFRSVV